MATGNPTVWWKGPEFKIALVVGLIVAVVGGIISLVVAYAGPSSSPDSGSSKPSAVDTSKPSRASSSSSPSASEVESVSPEPTESAAEPTSKFLSDMESLYSPLIDESETVDGRNYPHSTGVAIYGNCSGTIKSIEIDYPIDKAWRKFTATVGLSHDSQADVDVLFEVYLDGKLASPGYTVNLASTKLVDVSVAGIGRLTLKMIVTRGGEESCWVADGVWGDAQLSK